MAASILFSLACVLVSISAADICGIPKIKPVFHPTLNIGELDTSLFHNKLISLFHVYN